MKKIILTTIFAISLGYFALSVSDIEVLSPPKQELHEIYLESPASSKCIYASYAVGKNISDLDDIKVQIHCNHCYSGIYTMHEDGIEKCSNCGIKYHLKGKK
jgi:hypothetical protein